MKNGGNIANTAPYQGADDFSNGKTTKEKCGGEQNAKVAVCVDVSSVSLL
jgi:hypothetical protein